MDKTNDLPDGKKDIKTKKTKEDERKTPLYNRASGSVFP